jgi:hypothetical protein
MCVKTLNDPQYPKLTQQKELYYGAEKDNTNTVIPMQQRTGNLRKILS